MNSTIANGTTEVTLVKGENTTAIVDEIQLIATLEQRQFAKYVLFYFVLPFIALVGIIGNTLSFSLLRMKRGGNAFNIYLSALTLSDILLLILALARCVVIIAARYPDTRYKKLEMYGEFYLGLVLGIWLQRVSSTLISIIAIERFVAVAFPLKVKTLGLETHPVRTVVCTIVGTFLIQIPTFVLLEVKEKVSKTNETMYMVDLRETTESTVLARYVYLIILSVINMFVPLLIVAASTVAIVICLKLRPSRRFVNRVATDSSDNETMTMTLIALSTIFTICYIPAIVIYLLPTIDAAFFKRELFFIHIAVDVNIVCLCLNSASDFLIYIMASKNFRVLFVKYYCPCWSMARMGSSERSAIRHDGRSSSDSTCPGDSRHSRDTSLENISESVAL